MLRRITLKNFMSHRHTVLDLVDGVNVLTGPNNSGKSAVVSALQLLAELPVKEGDYMVRHGETDAQVTVETDENDVITWGRNTSATYLIINGERFSRIQNNRDHYLKKLHERLRLPKVSGKEHKQDFDIHFATQKEPIFLINEPSSRAAVFFASSSDAGRLVEVREKYKIQVNHVRDQKKTLDLKISEQKNLLEHFIPLDAIEEQMKSIRTSYHQIKENEASIAMKATLINSWNSNISSYKGLCSAHEILLSLKNFPHFDNDSKLYDHWNVLVKNQMQFYNISIKLNILNALQLMPSIVHENGLEKYLSDFRVLKFAHFNECCSSTTLSNLQVVPEMHECSALNQHIQVMQEVRSKYGLSDCQAKATKSLLNPPELSETVVLEKYISDWRSLKACANLLDHEFLSAKNEFQLWISSHPACPICGSELNVDHFLETSPHA